MIQRWLCRLVTPGDIPTVDLYLMNACGDLVARGLRRLAPTVFAGPGATIFVRHDSGLGALPRGRLVYLIDDDVEAGIGDPSLPALYRRKLGVAEYRTLRRLGAGASVVVVTSERLAHRWRELASGRAEIHRLAPYWDADPPGLEHFESLDQGSGWIDVAYLGGWAHRADLAFLWPALEELLRRHARLRFHLSERHRLPADVRAHPRVCLIRGRGWRAWRRALAGRRFHLALYPLLDSPFNRARSLNKLIEHGLVGAGGLYSACWPEARRAEEAGAGWALPNDPGRWAEAVRWLIARPGEMRALAAGSVALARRLNRPEPQRAFWSRMMGLEETVAA